MRQRRIIVSRRELLAWLRREFGLGLISARAVRLALGV